jgi:hypothetical protein
LVGATKCVGADGNLAAFVISFGIGADDDGVYLVVGGATTDGDGISPCCAVIKILKLKYEVQQKNW